MGGRGSTGGRTGYTVSARRVEVNTSGYEFSHGRKPRGTGNWAFGPEMVTDLNGIFWARGTYTQAKKAAQEWAAEQGYRRIYAQS